MEDELHKMLWDALGQERAAPIWRAIERRVAEQRATYEGAIEGWRARDARRAELLTRTRARLLTIPARDKHGGCIDCGRIAAQGHDSLLCDMRGLPDFIEELTDELATSGKRSCNG